MKQVTPDDLMTELSDLRVEIYNFDDYLTYPLNRSDALRMI